jgi:ActR/RegA family two-component response regulator
MNNLESQLRQATSDLAGVGAKFALVGGLAVSTRSEPRLTRDADLAIAVESDREAEEVVFAMQRRGYSVFAAVEQDATERLSTVRLVSPSGGITDLLFASSGIEVEIVERATEISVVAGLILPVASIGDLIAMKLLARDDRSRPADADDLRSLSKVATEPDWAVSLLAVREIEARGFARGRNLVESLRLLREHGSYGTGTD